jgi:hypothetical protein
MGIADGSGIPRDIDLSIRLTFVGEQNDRATIRGRVSCCNYAVKVDKEDNIWVADKGSDMVIKFSPEGRKVMVFGRKQEASDEGTGLLSVEAAPLTRYWRKPATQATGRSCSQV